MQDDVERVAQLLMDMDSDGRGYEDMARAAIVATLELTAEALRGLCLGETLPPRREREMFADWLQQRANDVREAGNG